jgi:ABC-type multidrug transport system ATPase subunit
MRVASVNTPHPPHLVTFLALQVGGTLPGGIMLRGMSGGERKRLAIACGVVAGPSLVFLDEPTSGLDSFAALNVVLFLKSMATEHGATLLASLHQPRAAIWSQMDQVGWLVVAS